LAKSDASPQTEEDKLQRYRSFIWSGRPLSLVDADATDVLAQSEREAGSIVRSLQRANFGDGYLETVHLEIAEIARSYDWTPPKEVIQKVVPLWRELAPRLGGHRHPKPERALFTFAGQLQGLFSYAALYVDEVSRARAFAEHSLKLGELAGSNTLRAWACGTLSMLYRFDDLDTKALSVAQEGLSLPVRGPLRSRLYAAAAESAAKLGDKKAVEKYLNTSLDEHAASNGHEALDLPGIFDFPEVKVGYYVGSALLELGAGGDIARRAVRHSSEAAARFGDALGAERSYPDHLVALGHVARARLQLDDVDGVIDALQQLLKSPTGSRTSWHRKMLGRVGRALSTDRYTRSPTASKALEMITEFDGPHRASS
jgi:hypothetical protein